MAGKVGGFVAKGPGGKTAGVLEGQKALPFDVDIRLDPKAHIKMQVKLTHDDHGQLGFVCREIDLDSISHLRRLIELNLGDQAELERELGALLEV